MNGEMDFDVAQARAKLASEDEEVRRQALAEIPDGWSAGAIGVLVDAMGDASWRVRKDAVARLAKWPDRDGVVAPLIATLADDSNVGLRNAAVEALATIGAPAIAPLCSALEAGGDHRKFLIEALGAIGDRRAVPWIVRALDDPDENVRAIAAEHLGNLGGGEAASALRERLKRVDLIARLAVLEALNRMSAALPYADVASMASQPILRRAALRALGNTGHEDALAPLLAGLGDRVRGAREAAAAGLSALHAAQPPGSEGDAARHRIEDRVRSSPPDAVSALVAAVSSDDVVVRRAAVTLLGWARLPQALPRLVDALRDEEVHPKAVQAIVAFGPEATAQVIDLAHDARSELKSEIFAILPRLYASGHADPRATTLLVQALEDEDPEAAAAAARALGDVGGRDSLAPLCRAISRDDDPIVANAATQTLSRLGRHADLTDEVRMLIAARGLGDAAIGVHLCRILGAVGRAEDRPMLLKALRGDDAKLRRAAAGAIVMLPRESDVAAREVREAVVFALADEEGAVRAAAAEALGLLADGAAVPALVGALGDDEEPVRVAAVRALGAVADPAAAAPLRERARGQGAIALHALEALGRLPRAGDGDETDALLIDALSRKDPEAVKAAVRALDVRGGPGAVTGLATALSHARWDVRRLAAEALGARAKSDAAARAALEARRAIETDALVSDAIAAALG
jgi:HEAT repeat protein